MSLQFSELERSISIAPGPQAGEAGAFPAAHAVATILRLKEDPAPVPAQGVVEAGALVYLLGVSVRSKKSLNSEPGMWPSGEALGIQTRSPQKEQGSAQQERAPFQQQR